VEQPSETESGPSAALSPTGEAVAKACREVLAALVEADGGRMFLVAASADDIHIHLAGTCAGCPGASLTTSHVLAPTLERVVPKAKLRVTTGWLVPEGALRLSPAGAPPP
jgi:Fe-S cluster biogenesis protein NfuA